MTGGQWGHNGLMSRQRCSGWRRRGTAAGTLTVVLPVLLSVSAAASPLASGPTPNPSSPGDSRLVDNELVVADLNPSGLPVSATLVDQLSATDLPSATYENPTSTTDLKYVGQRGAPKTQGAAAVVTVGGKTPVVTTQAKFGKPLPVALHAEYQRAGVAVEPQSIPGTTGELTITYTVTNTTARQQEIKYTDAQGTVHTEKKPVFAPFAGTLRVVLEPGQKLVAAPGAVKETTREGRTQLTWNLVLYPPLGDYTQKATLRISATSLATPEVRMEVVPVTSGEDPSVNFSTGLLDKTLEGNTSLAQGLGSIDESTLKLAQGSSQVTEGLMQLQASTDALAAGAQQAQSGSQTITDNLAALSGGLSQISEGLRQLAGPAGLPYAAETSQTLADAVAQLAAVVGSSTEASGPSLYKVAAAANLGAEELASKLRDVADALTQVAETQMAQVETQLSASQVKLLEARAAVVTASFKLCATSPPGCDDLQTALADLDAAFASQLAAQQTSGDARLQVNLSAGEVRLSSGGAEILAKATGGLQLGLAGVAAKLVSGDPTSPGVYEGLTALTAGLNYAAVNATRLATGADQSTAGANELTAGSSQLTSGLGEVSGGAKQLSDGTSQLATGSSQVSEGARQLQKDGTSKIYTEVVNASKDPAFARAYLTATDGRTTDAMPYGVPTGATGRVAYVYQMQPAAEADEGINWGVVGGVAVGLAALGYLGWRRVAGLAGAGSAAEPGDATPGTVAATGEGSDIDAEQSPGGDGTLSADNSDGPGVTDLRVD